MTSRRPSGLIDDAMFHACPSRALHLMVGLRAPLRATAVALAVTASNGPLSTYAQSLPLETSGPEPGEISIEVNPEFTRGRYGGPRQVDEAIVNTTFAYATGAWTVRLMVPWLRVKTSVANANSANDRQGKSDDDPADCVAATTRPSTSRKSRRGGDRYWKPPDDDCVAPVDPGDPGLPGNPVVPLPPGASDGGNASSAGLGDVSAEVAYSVPGLQQGLSAVIAAEWLLGTGDADLNLGAGRDDLSLSIEVAQQFGAWQGSARLGYIWRGDDHGAALRDGISTALGVEWQVTQATLLSVFWESESPIVAEAPAERLLGVGMTMQLDEHWEAGLYLVKGLSDTVADQVVGATLSVSF